MRTWLLHARESFWFLPAIYGIGAVVLALGLTEGDRLLVSHGIVSLPLIADLSATGGRAILTVIGGTMLGVAATSFSITISVLATTSTAYGPRLVRNFMADRGNQLVLAVLTSTFLYTLVVLRAVRTEQDSTPAFVPVIAVSFAVILAICDVAVLVFFIHHIASSVQVTTLQSRVLAELRAVIDLLYPENPTHPTTHTQLEGLTPRAAHHAGTSGYVQHLDVDRLVSLAEADDVIIRILTPPGTYVLEGDTVAEVMQPANATRAGGGKSHVDAPEMWSASSTKAIAAAISIGGQRTPHQDLRFAAQGLIEIGTRGLAAGTNDPYTAVAALDALSSAIVVLCSRPRADGQVPGEHGALRVLTAWPTPSEVIADVLLATRTYGMQHPLVVRAAIAFLTRIEPAVTGEERPHLREQAAALRAAYLATTPAHIDAEPLLTALDEVLTRLDPLTSREE